MLSCFDGVIRMGTIRGSMMQREWVRAGDLVLATLRSFQPGHADIVHEYSPSEVDRLVAYGEFPVLTDLSEAGADSGADSGGARDLDRHLEQLLSRREESWYHGI